jgi:hypothetical protein
MGSFADAMRQIKVNNHMQEQMVELSIPSDDPIHKLSGRIYEH